ncbi:MAG: serine/threonine protein kinase [Kofleriaceae bacterium]|nr:serine/threonine protein kinase [Kofleriaceae bacterium]
MGQPFDGTDDDEDGVVRDVHQTLLPSLSLSVLGGPTSRPSSPLPEPAALPAVPEFHDASASHQPAEPPPSIITMQPAEAIINATTVGRTVTHNRPRGAKAGDLIGGRYVVEGQLGRGGMGRVMRARHQALGKSFALKLIKAPIATDPKIRELFYREARLASALNHESICSIVDFGEDPSFGLFMVMELLDGQTVHIRTRQGGPLSAKAACDVMWQVCNAVRFIHARSIIHGDIKSENILLLRGAQQQRIVKLLDFGLARPNLNRAMVVDGTPEYLSPERIAGGAATQASDIYALGIVFFELLTGKLPFTGDVEEIFRQHREAEFPRVVDHGAEYIDERADQIIARATAKKSSDRHPDVAGFMYELRTLMNMLGMETTRRRAGNMAVGESGTRERRDIDHRLKAESELCANAPMPMASVDNTGAVRVANAAFLEFIGAAGDAGGIVVRDTGLEDVCPTILEDIRTVASQRQTVKRLIYLSEGGGRIVEAVIVLTPAARTAEVTAGDVHLLLHPLRVLDGD